MRRHRPAAVATITVAASFLAGGLASGVADELIEPNPREAVIAVPERANPLLADGVALGGNVAMYRTSGLGPAGTNTAAPPGTEQRYIDTAVFHDGALPKGVTITEAQGLSVLRRIGDNLTRAGLSYADVVTMRVFLANPTGEETADFAGWNRAYRQYFANVDLDTGEPIPARLGTAEPTTPFVVNDVRPSRSAMEVENLAVEGWLVEVEVDAVYPRAGK